MWLCQIYDGIMVMVNLDEVKETPITLFEDCGISFSDIQDSLQKTNGTFLGQPQAEWKALAEHTMKRMQEGSACTERTAWQSRKVAENDR
jgi:hypothetical protein